MFTKPILATLVLSLLFCSGCAKNRWLSRRDYSEMQDPFMESEAVADAESQRRSKGDTTGRARLSSSLADANPESDEREAAPLLGPKPIQQASAANDSEIRSGRIANAAYPRDSETQPGAAGEAPSTRSYEGPALSDFLQRKKTDSAPTQAQATAADATPRGQANFAQLGSISASTGAPASSMPKLSAEVDALATKFASAPTRGLALTKQLIRESGARTLDAQLDVERDAQRTLGRTSDYKEGVGAFMEKRKPKFTGS